MEDVADHEGLAATLRHVKLEKYIDNFPEDKTEVISGVTWGEYSDRC